MRIKLNLGKVGLLLSLFIVTSGSHAATVYTSTFTDNFGLTGNVFFVDAGLDFPDDNLYFDYAADGLLSPADFLTAPADFFASFLDFDIAITADSSGSQFTDLGTGFITLDGLDGLSTQGVAGPVQHFASCALGTCQTVGQLANPDGASVDTWTFNNPFTFAATNEGLPATVPVPAAAWLFGSGFLTLIGAARRKARA